jgi:hypothetical protein
MSKEFDTMYIDHLVDRDYPPMSMDGMQLAAADTGRLPEVVVTGEPEKPTGAGGPAGKPEPRFGRGGVTRAQSEAAGGLEVPVMGLADTLAGALRGTVAQSLGLPGDIESLVRLLTGGEQVLPTTERVSEMLPPVVPENAPDMVGYSAEGRRQTANIAGKLGEYNPILGAPEAVKIGVKGAKAAGAALAPAAANVIESNLRKAGMIMDIAPSGPGQVVVPVKIGEREIKIPAKEAASLQRALKNLTPQEQAKFRSDTAVKFVNILKTLPSKEEFGAAAVAGKAKKGWYEGSTQAIIQVFGPDSQRFAALLSATSPQTSVESNLFNALQVWKNWTAAGRPIDRASIVRIMGDSVQGSKGEESVLDAWINNSVKALSAEDPSTVVLSGPKVNSFMLNLQGNVNEVTNDAWMAAFTYVDQNLFSGGLTKGGDPGKGPGYIAMNARVRETADYLTKFTGEKWTPAEVQETIWSWAKTLYETASAKGETRSAVQLIQDNAITDELIAATPDFRTLFYDERFGPILEQAGYSEQLAQLRAATSGSDVAAGAKKPGASGQAGTLDPEAQRKYLERNAKRLDKLRKDREKEAAAKAKAKAQMKAGGAE